MEPIEIAGFPITANTQISRFGEHRGVKYKISNHARYEEGVNRIRGTWCYYVYINELILDENDFSDFWLEARGVDSFGGDWKSAKYDYWAPVWADADWHGGVTHYQKIGGLDGSSRLVEIGCDYAHLYDDQRTYNYEWVEMDAKRTIDALHRLYDFAEYDRQSGKYVFPKKETAAKAIDDIRNDLAALDQQKQEG